MTAPLDETDEETYFLGWDAPLPLAEPFCLVSATGGCSPYTLLRRKTCSREGVSLCARAEELINGGAAERLATFLTGGVGGIECVFAALAIRNLALSHPPSLSRSGAPTCVHATPSSPAARCCVALPALITACAPHVVRGEQRVALALARAVRALCTGHDGARRAACAAAEPLLRGMVAAPVGGVASALVRRAAVEALVVARGWGGAGEPSEGALLEEAARIADALEGSGASGADISALEDAATECRVFLCCACPDAACAKVDLMAEMMVRVGAPARLAALLGRRDAPSLQREAAMCLANIAAGLEAHARAAACAGAAAIPLLAALLESPSHSVAAAGAWALGNIAGHGGVRCGALASAPSLTLLSLFGFYTLPRQTLAAGAAGRRSGPKHRARAVPRGDGARAHPRALAERVRLCGAGHCGG